jgi:hypothetical protein
VFNKFKLVDGESWVTYWLIPNESGANVVMQDSNGCSFNNAFTTYELAADAFVSVLIAAKGLGFVHVIS